MRRITCLAFVILLPLAAAPAGDASVWFDRAVDPELSRRQREFATEQLLMLADSSASMFLSILKEPGPDTSGRRRLAARLLGDLGLPDAEAPLWEAAFSPDYFLAEAAVDALAKLYSRLSDDDLYALLKAGGREPGGFAAEAAEADDWLALSLRAAENRSRFRAVVLRGLAMKYARQRGTMPEALTEFVFQGLLDSDRELRAAAVAATTVSDSPLAPVRLSSFLFTENDPKLLTAALAAMGKLRPPEFGEGVERQAANADPLVSVEALAALAAMGYENAMFPAPGFPGRTVAGYVNHPSTPVRRRAVECLADTKDPRATEYLAFALRDRVAPNREAAARALGELGFTAAIGPLSPLLNDPAPEVRAAAAVALDKLGVVGVSARLLDDLEGDDPAYRRQAAATLGRLGDRRAVTYLQTILDDPDSELAANAAASLGVLGDRSATAALYRALSADDPMVADAARRALTRLYHGDDPGDAPSTWESWARRNKFDAARRD